MPPTYTPPGLKSSSKKSTPSKAPSSVTKKSTSPSKSTPKAPTVSIESKVAKLESNDRRQDLRLSHLERDVGLLPDTIEGGGGMADVVPTGKRYVMRPGDTLWSVASRHGVSVNALRSVNHLSETSELGLGETLIIPDGDVASPLVSRQPTRIHIVRSGDTFTKIARDYGISTDALARANPSAYADRLLIGERLSIPGGNGGGTISSPQTVTTITTTKATHIVKKGEHLGSIAKKYGVSTATLAKANRLKNANVVVIGQRLSIPGVKTTRTVPTGLAANPDTIPLHDMRLAEPAPLVKPEPPVPPAAPALPPITSNSAPAYVQTSAPAPRGVVAYRMERGDTLSTVANMFSTTEQNIRSLNKLAADKVVKEGEEIIVPSVGAVSVN